ncbi:MAG: methylated-DNA--[protein]-cysteine S-methyltransferase [Phycisphaerae bacterium]
MDEVPAERISDDDLRAMSIDPARARRYFKKSYGMTFQVYSRARRMGVALGQIREGTDLTSVALGHGYDSNSGFRHAFERTFGGPPGRCRSEECLVTQMIESPIGRLMACATSSAVCLLEFTERRSLESQVDTLRKRFRRAIVPGANAHLQQLREELAAYFAGERAAFSVAIDYPGTPFQVAVWDRLLQIPYGETLSYSRLAEDVGRQGASRAAGRANGDNRLAILIPCHRVVNKNGRLGGYGGGLWRKQFLLDLERGGAA